MSKIKTIRIEGLPGQQEDRFARLKLIKWWDQELLKKSKILVIGAGALGNEILKNLALLGIGHIFIADMDRIENSNLSRSVLFREKDNGSQKAEIAARSVKDIFPDLKVQWFDGDVIYSLGLGVYQWADLVICGLDNREARLSVNRNCWKTNTPWIDGAIEQLNGIARVFIPPDGVCYECTMSEVDWQIIKARKACSGLTRDEMLSGKTPTTPTSSSIIAGIQCQEAVKLLHGLETLKDKAFIFNGLTHESYIIHYQKKDDCLSHETFHEIRKIDKSVYTSTLGELVQEIKNELGEQAVIEFIRDNNDIIYQFNCSICQNSQVVFKSVGKTFENECICPVCKSERTADIFHNINGQEGFLNKTFSEIGIPPYDIMIGRNGINQFAFVFEKDAASVLGPILNA